jgi:4-hydroxy-tetrahydrodipicolinate reductase
VLFLGQGERLELVHRSATRDHFARGALRAAAWLTDRSPGLYDMEHVLGLPRA